MPELKTKTKTKTEKHFILVLIHQWHIRNYVAKYKFVRHVFPLLSTCPSNTIHCILGIHSLSVHYLLFLLWQSFERNFRQTAIAPRAAAAAWTRKRTQRDRWEATRSNKTKTWEYTKSDPANSMWWGNWRSGPHRWPVYNIGWLEKNSKNKKNKTPQHEYREKCVVSREKIGSSGSNN